MVVGIPAGDLLLVVKRTFIVVDNSEVEQPFDIFASSTDDDAYETIQYELTI